MDTRKPRIAITHGDTNGIGYELIFKTFADPQMLELCTPIVYGSPKVAAYHRKSTGSQTNFTIIDNAANASESALNILTCIEEEVRVEMGTPSAESGIAAMKSIDGALADYPNGAYDALVACPTDDHAIRLQNPDYSNMKEYIETRVNGGKKSLSMLLNDRMRIASATRGADIRDVAKEITRENIERRVICLYESLRRDFMLSCPRIALLTLNHEPSDEERESIAPAVEELSASIVGTFGPYTSRQLFGGNRYGEFDGILAMYDDQAATPFETLSSSVGCKYLAGLPLVCTTTTHGARHDIAGTGTADESSLRQAIYTAIDICKNRRQYDEPLANPLQKLYHEKRDESEKARYSVPKKREEQPGEQPKEK